MDACVPLESSSCTLRRVLECFTTDTGVAMALFSGFDFDFRFAFHFSCATLFDRISHQQLVVGPETRRRLFPVRCRWPSRCT